LIKKPEDHAVFSEFLTMIALPVNRAETIGPKRLWNFTALAKYRVVLKMCFYRIASKVSATSTVDRWDTYTHFQLTQAATTPNGSHRTSLFL